MRAKPPGVVQLLRLNCAASNASAASAVQSCVGWTARLEVLAVVRANAKVTEELQKNAPGRC